MPLARSIIRFSFPAEMAGGVKIWIDAQLSPTLAQWLTGRFDVEAVHVSELHLVNASDPTIFGLARSADAMILTKDRDFVELVHRRGTPPQVIWITCGNTSNDEMMRVLDATFERACELLASGEAIVEIKG
jgi:predicted nuclease of predicted toxin-antitoxin system